MSLGKVTQTEEGTEIMGHTSQRMVYMAGDG